MSRYCFPSLIELCHSAIKQSLLHILPDMTEKKVATKEFPALLIDGTCGNGHDLLFLCSALDEIIQDKKAVTQILSFDVQEQALTSAREYLHAKLPETNFDHVSFLHKGHEYLNSYIPEASGIVVAMYNLGFLPRSDKSIITKAETTITSLATVKEHLVHKGLLSVHSYAGHAGGDKELEAVDAWFSALPESEWAVAKYFLCNKSHNPEALFLAERLEQKK